MRIVALIIGTLMLVVAIFFRLNTPTQPLPVVTPDTEITGSNITTFDEDGDGFPNWQELLYGSDPNSSTSTPDNAERTSTKTYTSSSSATNELARTFLSQYLNASNNGADPVGDIETLGTSIAENIQEPSIHYNVVLAKDIHTINTTDAAKIKYKKDLKEALSPIKEITEVEIETYWRLVTGDTNANTELARTVAIYKTAAKNASSIDTPIGALAAHLGAINALGYYAAVLDTMRTNNSDPVESLTLLRAYNEAERNMFTSFQVLNNFLSTIQ